LLKDKEKAKELMLPKETENVQNIQDFMGHFNIKIEEEILNVADLRMKRIAAVIGELL